MSEINKPEVTEIENKLPEHKSLNPDQYKCNHVVAPENSCPWAIRKVRWASGSKGKRGGVRIIYYYKVDVSHIRLLLIYRKGIKDDLSESEKKVLRALNEGW
ncbi:type II toxin-antitoxin system RelE/ParE family toxin [Photorhabdus africana]|uniref:type II toxin-antitoxin system RelE/ParE family toxin n=1 Tax=Photorhabdus africana TaxID=3097554 RepID=UPI002B416C53|nr:type II toxin-antitoxin system RelE/ParE family toxin [Photorhabdus sp. CRI-LC]